MDYKRIGGVAMSRIVSLALVIALLVPLAACNLQIGNEESSGWGKLDIETPEGARQTISQLNIPYTVDEFVQCARESDMVAVELFLTAGMNPSARDSGGTTALEAATQAGHLEIVEVLEYALQEE
jgi:hypothetical protein